MTTQRLAEAVDVEQCVDVLRRLPDHFTPDTWDEARSALAVHRAWVATDGDGPLKGDVVGFVLVERRYRASAEITFTAVRPDRQGTGVGAALVEHALGVLAHEGVAVVEVKPSMRPPATSPMWPPGRSGSTGVSTRSTASIRSPAGSPVTRAPSTWRRSDRRRSRIRPAWPASSAPPGGRRR